MGLGEAQVVVDEVSVILTQPLDGRISAVRQAFPSISPRRLSRLVRKAIEQEKISLGRGAEVLLMDANVLIDYQKSDLSVLGLVNKHVAEVHVLTPGRPTAKSPPPKCALGIWQLGASGSIWPFAMSLSRDFIEFIACLNASRVEYLLVGGHALAFHGLPRFTKDIDFWIRPSEENADRVLAALESFGFG